MSMYLMVPTPLGSNRTDFLINEMENYIDKGRSEKSAAVVEKQMMNEFPSIMHIYGGEIYNVAKFYKAMSNINYGGEGNMR